MTVWIQIQKSIQRISSRDLKDKDNGYGNVLSEIEETCSKKNLETQSFREVEWPDADRSKIRIHGGMGKTFTHKVSTDDHLGKKSGKYTLPSSSLQREEYEQEMLNNDCFLLSYLIVFCTCLITDTE